MGLQKKKIRIKKKKEQHGSAVPYANESVAITTGEEIKEEYKNQFGNLLERFLTYCVEHNPTAAYNLLSTRCRNISYENEKSFEKLWYSQKFEGDKSYKFKLWSTTDDNYVYLVQIFDDLLTSGISSNSKYIEDYITIAPEEDLLKVNINGYINTDEIHSKASNNLVTAEVVLVDNYMEEKIYTINFKNNTDSTIILDTRENPETTYLVDANGNRIFGVLYENIITDLELQPKEAKTIQIKFNATYRNGTKIQKMEFTNMAKEEDLNNSNILSIVF